MSKNNMYAVVISTNFDPETNVHIFKDEEMALNYLQKDYKECLAICRNEDNGFYDFAMRDYYAYIEYENGDTLLWKLVSPTVHD